MRTSTDGRTEVVLFDLGGVLVRLSGSAMDALATSTGPDFWARWLACRWVRAFERGRCSAQEFAEGVVDDWDLAMTPDALLDAVHAWPTGLEDGALALVAEVRGVARVGCLTNTNALHWATQFTEWGLHRAFDHAFASHLVGLVKPDRDLFEHVVEQLGVDAGRVVFLDDNLVNVEGARAVGMVAEQVRGVDGARGALIELGVLPPSA